MGRDWEIQEDWQLTPLDFAGKVEDTGEFGERGDGVDEVGDDMMRQREEVVKDEEETDYGGKG